jgi:D-xylose transport system substrate-binding protein
VGKFSGGAKGVEVNAILLAPNPITKDNLNDVIDAGWITKEEACAGVKAGTVAACN